MPAQTEHKSPVLERYDIAICGGGLVGASLALMLKPLGLKILMIEAQPFQGSEHPSFDERTTAISNGSRRIFSAIGAWTALEPAATPIERIHVSDKGRFGFARLSASDHGLVALGYVVPNWKMGGALWDGLQAMGIEVVAPAKVIGTVNQQDCRSVVFEDAGVERRVDARLVVAADGARSLLRASAGIDCSEKSYGQTAIIANALPQMFHHHVAYERFTAEGPLAVLPLADTKVGLVWVRSESKAVETMALSDQAFLSEFQQQFGFRLGRFLRVGRRYSYPLSLIRANEHTQPRFVVMGNAAQMLHPVSGQGLNLGLRDAASLAELLADGMRINLAAFDPGDPAILAEYAQWRAEDSKRIIAFTDGLVRLFTHPLGVVRWIRSAGLLAFDLLPPLKSSMARLSVGASSRIPRLSRGAVL